MNRTGVFDTAPVDAGVWPRVLAATVATGLVAAVEKRPAARDETEGRVPCLVS